MASDGGASGSSGPAAPAIVVEQTWPPPDGSPGRVGAPSGPSSPPVRRPLRQEVRRSAPWALSVMAAVAVAVTFAPWLRTGAARRTSYQVVRAADRLQVLPPGPQAVITVAWAFLPLVAVLAAVAALWGRRRIGAALALLVGAGQVGLAVAVKFAPRAADWGTTAGLVAGSALVVVALVTAITSRSTP